jgi:lysophospholipase L1-like esterase/pimeloyl-ACP methyl ester carboxylesterase
MRKVSFFLLSLFFCVQLSNAQVKVACIGASITYGHGIAKRETFSFPGQLQILMGTGYQISNYGVSGTTLLSSGDNPYVKTDQYQQALKSNPDVVFIDLGGNDAKLVNRVHLDEFEGDYRKMIKAFREMPSHPRVILMLPMVSFVKDTTGIWDPVIVNRIAPKIRNVAFETGLEVLDMHQLLIDHPEMVPDLIHPDVHGSALLAMRMYETLQAKKDERFDVFQGLKGFTKDSFYGYECAGFKLKGRECKVVKPKWAAPGHPYIWRARFWGHEPQADIALLERGFHVVYCDASELLGNPEAIALWDDFYNILAKAGLSKKAALEGMSRGAVYVYNWAAANPAKVACAYVDNPVLDMKTWPGAKENALKYKQEHEQFMKDYGLGTDEDVQNFKGSPVDKIEQIAKGGYPSLILCADADEAVSPETNTLAFEKKIKAAGGVITVVHKPGFKHHPHSMPNPKVIVDFVLQSTALH